jgi:TolB-like protein/Tfp pilus assembly protein PilF
MNLFAELRRRNVFRVAGVYAVVGWLLAQAAALLENALGMPGWFDTVVVSFLLLGLPVALIFAWAFEMTPQGVKRTAEVRPEESITDKTGRKLDYAIIAGLALVVVVVAADRMTGGGAPQGRMAEIAATPGDNSIAVLPFVDMSPDGDQEYFADGISEELLNVLAKVKTLQVAGRTSSFAFKNDNRDLREIGELLKVAHILEGSVRKSGDRVRITAQLIRAENGYHMWSDTFDGELTDIFALQDKVANAIFVELKKELNIAADEEAAPAPAPRADVGAYELFLRAREMIHQVGGESGYEQARALLDEAIEIDPNYAPALAWRAYVEFALADAWGDRNGVPLADALPKVRDYAERALAADPQSPDAHFALGSYHSSLYLSEGKGTIDEVIGVYREAVALRPNFPQAQVALANMLRVKGELEEAIGIFENVLEHDPGHRDANENYISTMIDIGRFEEAAAALNRWMAVRPDPTQKQLYEAYSLLEQGKSAEALKMAEKIDVADDQNRRYRDFTIRYARYDLGDLDWVRKNAVSQIEKASIALAEGDAEAALALIEAPEGAPYRNNPHSVITVYNRFLHAAGQYEKIAQHYEETLKTPEAAIAEIDACGCGGMDFLVSALQKTGHKDAKKLLALWDDMAARKSVIYARSYGYHRLEASRALLNGDEEKAAEEFGKAMDYGWRSLSFTRRGVEYADLPDNADFDALLARMLELINEQRAKAGMEPMPGGEG